MKNLTPVHDFSYDTGRIKVFHANAGEGLVKHEHTFPHATFCMDGKCVVRKEGKEITLDKFSQPIELFANEWHEIEAIEDGTVFCNVLAEEFNS